ncbi:hypothetical protein SADUNF_Sadunf12G0101500 [Salix dunnii]|uniref:Uncharacterized protein n=1 Tax=Salix dunnii TaxID=1413687 RepID=A0A835MPS0_9ROSI|nr:hypothetical protein SADUNF_Sadunf12G0101500 [Salix dunnii]
MRVQRAGEPNLLLDQKNGAAGMQSWDGNSNNPLRDDNHKHQKDDSAVENFGEIEQGMFSSDLESFSFKTDNSFCSAPSILANCLASSVAIFTAVPVQETSPTDDINSQLETPSSITSETDSNTSS